VLDRLAADVTAGTFRVPIQRTYRLEETAQAIGDFARGTIGKLAIPWPRRAVSTRRPGFERCTAERYVKRG
jgi:hypothetical protein